MSLSLEALIEELARGTDEGEVSRAQAAFFELGGAYEPGEPFYEERSRAFFDWMVCAWQGGAVARRARRPGIDERRDVLLRALTAPMRSIFEVEAEASAERGPRVRCLLGGAAFELEPEGAAARLREGDVLDARVVGVEGAVLLLPGPVFHPREAHEALREVLRRAVAEGREEVALCDALLRVRMRFDRFTSMQARHVYRYDALDRKEILAASWAR